MTAPLSCCHRTTSAMRAAAAAGAGAGWAPASRARTACSAAGSATPAAVAAAAAIDAGAVGVARGAVAAVRAVHIERDRDLGERVREPRRVDREAGRSRGGVERLPDACPLRCEQFLQHHALGRGLDRRERGVTVLGVERGVEHGAPVRIDEHRGERVRRLVASGAGDRPHRVERFVGGQDLLDVHRVVRHLRRDACKVRSRVGESVDVVDSQPVRDTVVQELEASACDAPNTSGSSARTPIRSDTSKKRR
jgi:hypothetical protein